MSFTQDLKTLAQQVGEEMDAGGSQRGDRGLKPGTV
jgi:hypothetical protein